MSLLAEIHARRQRFHAEIARRAALVQPKAVLTYSIPNDPPGKPKTRPEPMRRLTPDVVVPQTMPEWYPFMWFWDLIDAQLRPPASVASIQLAVCKKFGIERADMLCSRRVEKFVFPRQVAMYLCRQTGRSLPEIGRRFGGKDHTTILHASRKIETLIQSDPDLAQKILGLKAELRL